jgi:Metallo-beta-lactamase superfamily
MKKTFLFLVIFSSINLFSYAQYGQYDTAKTVPPFKIFDNLYYVGNDWVSSYLLTTSDGLILIDALYGKYPSHILESVHDLGFDAKQIKYILCTHAHYDHYEGADTLQRLTHARVGMTDPDWQMVEGKIKTGLESVNAHLIFGLFTRVVALYFIAQMIVAVLSTKIGLFLGTSPLPLPPAPPKTGIWAVKHEIRSDYAQILTCLFLAVEGAGKLSLDFIRKKGQKIYKKMYDYQFAAE